NRFKNDFIKPLITIMMISFAASCSKDNTAEQGTANLYVTDAAIDNADIQGVFVTVANIKINGKALTGFSKQTINLMAYQKGETKLLGSEQIEAGAYNNIEIYLDQDLDEDGNSPGCYMLTSSGKENLASTGVSTHMITATGAFSVIANSSTDLIIDFNLRKAVKEEGSGTGNYTFVAQAGLDEAVRIVPKNSTGNISGTYDGTIGSDQIVVAYAYKKGEYNDATETVENSNGVCFANAQNCDRVEGAVNGTYKLSFLEEGDYELHFAEFSKNSDGTVSLQNMLNIDTSGDISADNIRVTSGMDVSLSIILKGTL
ncbi:MAG TPA: DUF4382 domain-containing protein, partial [Cyclobacteriaceae bacterium]|nr:DUF4382 domain-containing protein [Cyclobacteriaceae bacterium]